MSPVVAPKPKSSSRSRVKEKVRTRLLLLTRAHLDGRGPAARAYDRLLHLIEADLAPGGSHELSSIERTLVQAFCGSAILIDHLNARLLAGEEVDAAAHAATVSALVRVASRLGLRRRSKDITPSLAEFAALHDQEAREARNGALHELDNHLDAEVTADAMREFDNA
jgi:hypothetical protein